MPERIDVDADAVSVLKEALELRDALPSLGADNFGKVFPRSGLLRFDAKEYVLHQDEAGRDVYVVLDGLVTITQMGERMGAKLATLRAGTVFGEIALTRSGSRNATAIATEPSRIFQIAFQDVEDLSREKPEVGERLKSLAAKRLEES